LKTRLGREFAVVFAVKLVALYALWALLFSDQPARGAQR
jgi:hypothetical protein